MNSHFRWQYQSKAEPILPPDSPDKWYQPTSEVVAHARASLAAATFLVAATTTLAYCPDPNPSGQIVKIDHEEGDFSDYDSTVNVGDMSVAQPGLAVTDNTLKVTLNDTDDHYGKKHIDWRTEDLRVGLHLDLRDIDFGTPTDHFQVWSLRNNAGDIRVALYLANDPSKRVFWAAIVDDSLVVRNLPLTETSDNPHIEIVVKRASGPSLGSSDGTFEMFVNGVLVQSLTDLQLYTLDRPNELRVGPQDAAGSFSGNLLLDEICIRDDTTAIERVDRMPWYVQGEPPVLPEAGRSARYLVTPLQEAHHGLGPIEEVWFLRVAPGPTCEDADPAGLLLETAGSTPTSTTARTRPTWGRTETVRSIEPGTWGVVVHSSGFSTLLRVIVARYNSSCVLQQVVLDITQVVPGGPPSQTLFIQPIVPRVDFNDGDVLLVIMGGGTLFGEIFIHYEDGIGTLSNSFLIHPIEVPSPPDFDWEPSYPDQILTSPTLVPEGAWVGVLDPSLITLPAIDWMPSYPSLVPGVHPPVQEGLWTGVLEERAFGTPVSAWAPSFLDIVLGAPPLLQGGYWSGVLEKTLVEVQEVSWIPETNQPVRVVPLVREGWVTQHLDIAPPVPFDWIPITNQPSAGRPPLVAEGYWAGVLFPELFASQSPSWMPEFRLPPAPVLAALQAEWWVGVLDKSLIETQNLSWVPVTNQPPAGLPPLLQEGWWAGVLNEGLFGLQDLSWLPETNQPPRGPIPLTTQDYWTGITEPTAFFVPSISGWLPTYDAMVHGHVPPTQEGLWAGVLEDSLFVALSPTSTFYYRQLTIVRRRRT